MSRKKLLIINKSQFGYHIDTYYYCKYLKDDFDITYICFDIRKEKISMDGVNIIYVSSIGNFFYRGYNFINHCRKYIKSNLVDLVFINYFQAASFIKFGFDENKFIIDIRTGAIGRTQIKRNIYNFIMRFEANMFKHITIISKCLQNKLNFKSHNISILPLGADLLSSQVKSFKKLKLMYIGTLDSRNIHETIFGLAKFVEKNKNVSISYDIFGSGYKINEDKLKDEIVNNNLDDIVTFHGRKEHDELQAYFDECNIGVSYIPITEYFDCQPATKTFEYINSGMFCIATKTQENIKLISKENGVLCMDNPESFYDALNFIYQNTLSIDAGKISNTLTEYTWKNIISDQLRPVLNNVLTGSK